MQHSFSPQTTYVIRFQNSNHHFSQFGWFLAVDFDSKSTLRSEDTKYAIIQRPIALMQFDYSWKITPTHQGTYIITLATGKFTGFELYSSKNIAQDERDIYSYRVFVAPHGYCTPNNCSNRWRFEYMGDNVFMIQNAKTGRYLSAHRYYEEEILGQDSTMIETHSSKSITACWKIVKY